jgi:hypothetical protein
MYLPWSLAGHTVSAAMAREAAGLYAAPSSIHHSQPALLTWGPAEALQVQAVAAGADAADQLAAPVLAPAAARAVSVPAAAGMCLRNMIAG